jgi:hypothetical protein
MRWIVENELPTNSSSGMYSLLSSVETNQIRYLPNNPRWEKAQDLMDPWHSPYLILIENVPSTGVGIQHKLEVISLGHNRRYEHGGGDDIPRSAILSKN